jgi:hypothetical protein
MSKYPRVSEGQTYRYVGNEGRFFTPGKAYAVTHCMGDAGKWFQIDDDVNGNHNWQDDASFHEKFELVNGPVRTVTRKVIKPGKYGHVLVDRTANDGALVMLGFKTTGGIFPECRSLFSADELRAAATTLIELADALPLNAEGGDK